MFTRAAKFQHNLCWNLEALDGSFESPPIFDSTTNCPPEAWDELVDTGHDAEPFIVVLPTKDPDGDPLSVVSLSSPKYVSVENATGTVDQRNANEPDQQSGLPAVRIGLPDGIYHERDSFEFTVTDGHGGTATATITVNIVPTSIEL